MNCQVIRVTGAKAIHALPDGEYHTNSISPMYFKKKDGVLEFNGGKTIKTVEEFVSYWNGKTIVGPLIEFEIDEEMVRETREFAKKWKEKAKKTSLWLGW